MSRRTTRHPLPSPRSHRRISGKSIRLDNILTITKFPKIASRPPPKICCKMQNNLKMRTPHSQKYAILFMAIRRIRPCREATRSPRSLPKQEGKSPQNASPIVLRRNRQNIPAYFCCAKKEALERSFEVTRIFIIRHKPLFLLLFSSTIHRNAVGLDRRWSPLHLCYLNIYFCFTQLALDAMR